MKCISINGHDYSTRAYGDPTANAALNKIMREQARKPKPSPRLSMYFNEDRTRVIRQA